jgi:aspartate aminotransferase
MNTMNRVSTTAAGLIGSEILKIAADVRALVASGTAVCNLTVGDFAPSQFPIPEFLEREIVAMLAAGETNYPPADGMPQLRRAIVDFYERTMGITYPLESVLVTGGSRPGIYSTYVALVDPGESVVYPVPSWNNNHYTYLVGARGVPVLCEAKDAFLPTRKMLEPAVRGARLLALNSPLNPCGTALTAEGLEEICDLVLEENARRSSDERPLFLLYDQVYWTLTFGATRHVHPEVLRPAMANYTVTIDGISKAFAATGVRVGWTTGPADVTNRMAAIVGHVGAWAPRAEQVATARLLDAQEEIDRYHVTMKAGVQERLDALYAGIQRLRDAGYPIEAIPPMGAIYLSVRFALHGRRTDAGTTLASDEEIRRYLLETAGVAIVPFSAFGMEGDAGWFRLSVGAVSIEEIESAFTRLEAALARLEGVARVEQV